MLVSFSSFKRGGKDTAANYLVNNFGFIKVSFANPLKEHIYILNPLVECEQHDLNPDYSYNCRLQDIIDRVGWDSAKELYPEVRRLLQIYGTQIGRDKFGENIWIDLAFRKIQSLENAVISDSRFPNEIEAVKDFGGYLIKIKRSGLISTDTHASEQDLPDSLFDFIVENNGTILELEQKIKTIYESLS